MSTFDGPKQEIKISKAKKALSGAMLVLLEKQSFQKITVNDLCETALVSRATFYIHFEDKYHLLKFCLADIKRQLVNEGDTLNSIDLIRRILDYIYEKPHVFKNLILKETNQELMEMLGQLLVQDITKGLMKLETARKNVPPPVPVSAIFIAGGLSYLILWWISNGFPIEKEEMIEYLADLSVMRTSI